MITGPAPSISERRSGVIARALRVGFAALAFAVTGALLAVVPVQPAAAAGPPRISVSPASGLNPDGDYVMVSGSGFEVNTQLFVMQCRNNSGEDHTCNSVGLQKVETDGAGNFSTRRPVQVSANMGSTDCRSTPCAIKTSAVSGHSGDRSQDVLAGISFGAPPATQPPATQPPATQPPATQPPATAPPTTAAPAATTTTEALVDTTTTTDASTTTTAAAPTTTSAPAAVTELAGGTDTPASSGDDEGSSPVPWIVAGLVLISAAVGGGIYTLRARAAR